MDDWYVIYKILNSKKATVLSGREHLDGKYIFISTHLEETISFEQ